MTRWCKVDLAETELISELGRVRKKQGRGRAREATVSVKRDTDERTDNIVKAYDPRCDLLLLEGEGKKHAELNISCNKMCVCVEHLHKSGDAFIRPLLLFLAPSSPPARGRLLPFALGSRWDRIGGSIEMVW